MSLLQEPPSSPPDASSTSPKALLAYYKSNYEQLELELADFQASSRELETELEKDVEAAEKRERKLREKVESLGYEVEEWKTKCKQAKAEANTAQNTLQKEITSLRDSNRTMQLKLRDIEVANDDFERQARNTSSSLEDLESKYNVAIERAVMLEAEMQSGDQEREALRIDSQRLRDELSDLKIEAEITQGKLRHQEEAANRERGQHLRPSWQALAGPNRPQSPASSDSPSMMTATSSPLICTPPRPKSASTDTTSEVATPPSPTTSEKSSAVSILAITTPSHPLKPATTDEADSNTTPRPTHFPRASHVPPRHSRTSSIQPISASYPVNARTRSTLQPRIKAQSGNPGRAGVPQSSSLRQIRGLIGQVAKLEERVHSARSRLPAPVHTPPHASPRNDSALGHHSHLPAGVTVRSHKKRVTGSMTSRSSSAHEPVEHAISYSTRPVSRLSFGIVPHSASIAADRTGSRPSSRASISSRTSIGPSTSTAPSYQRPLSRASLSGARTPLGHHNHTSSLSLSGAAADSRRARSSISGSYGTLSGQCSNGVGADEHPRPSRTTTAAATTTTTTTTPIARRSLLAKSELDLTMTPSSIPTAKRMSGGGGLFLNNASVSHKEERKGYGAISGTAGSALSATRRTSSGMSVRKDPAAYGGGDLGEMGPPERRKRLSGVGETF